MHGIHFTKHAKERMAQRSISPQDVIRVLAFGDPRETRSLPCWSIRRRNIKSRYPDLDSVTVVFTDSRVVTAYRAGVKASA